MRAKLPRRARQLEFAFAVLVIALPSWYLIGAVARLQEDAERVTIESTVRNLNSALLVEQSKLMIAGREAELPALARSNPIDWMEAPPGYIGAGACQAPGLLQPGQWCWESVTQTLFYRPQRSDTLKIAGDLPWLTWRVKLPGDLRAIRPGTLRLAPAVAYTWRP